jgi:hypothetical protein
MPLGNEQSEKLNDQIMVQNYFSAAQIVDQ